MTAPYDDPYGTAIDDDPHPVWKRLRDEAVDYERAHDAHTTNVRGWASLALRTRRAR